MAKQKSFVEKVKLWLPPTLLFVVLFTWMGVSYYIDQKRGNSSAQNSGTTQVNIEGYFTVELPCNPGDGIQSSGQDRTNTTTYTCTLMNDDGSIGNTYYTSNKVYENDALITPEVDYVFCDTYTDNTTGEIMSGKTKYQKTINDRLFQFCEYAGDRGTELATAKTQRGQSLQTYAALGKGTSSRELADSVSQYLTSFVTDSDKD